MLATQSVIIDLSLLERWLTGWSLARGLPLPSRSGGGLVVEVAWPQQLPFTYVKALVDAEQLRLALPAHWKVESPSYFMVHPTAMAS
jgi:hypothetical protein